jgi:hypothetical protein
MQNPSIKKLSPEKKLQLALDLYFNARELKISAIKKFHPELTEKEVNEKVKQIFLYAKS